MDPHDPTVIAEAELLSAANQIEAAAKKLAMLQPRIKPKVQSEGMVMGNIETKGNLLLRMMREVLF